MGPREEVAGQSARAAHSGAVVANASSASVLDGEAELLAAGDTRGSRFGGGGRAGGGVAISVSGEAGEATDAADVSSSGYNAARGDAVVLQPFRSEHFSVPAAFTTRRLSQWVPVRFSLV